MGVVGRKFKDKDGNRVIILHQLGVRGTSKNDYALANLDDNSVSIDYNAKSLGVAVSQFTAEEWEINDGEFTPSKVKKLQEAPVAPKKAKVIEMKAGIVKGMQDTVSNFCDAYNSAYLDQHGFSKLGIFVKPDSDVGQSESGPMITRYSLKIEEEDTPFLGVKETDVVEYLGDSKWKFVKHGITPEE